MTTSGTVASSASTILELDGVSKKFGPVVALRNGKLVLKRGSIHALVGENGAGKSTLVKVIAGLYKQDSGKFEYEGHAVDFANAADSKTAGIAVIYQEPTLFPDLTVAENVFMGRQPTGFMSQIDKRRMREDVKSLFEWLGVDMNPARIARGLSIADQQLVEIAKAMSLDAKVLVMDEPTAALSGVEVERLFSVVRSLRDRGCGVVFISHRFDEVFDLCDTVTVMRDGEYIDSKQISQTSVDEIVRQMVGREVATMFPKFEAAIGGVALSVRNLTREGVFDDVSFDVRSGEIVALAGLVGAGRSEIARAVFGIDPYDSGTVDVLGKRVRRRSPADAMAKGVGFIPEDRRHQGTIGVASVARNITIAIRETLASFGIINSRDENAAAQEWASKLEVKTAALDTPVGNLSGGNQQKTVIAKWLATRPSVIIVDEPTRGIDVGTKAEVHRLLSELAVQGLAVLMISSELPEVLGMADRVLVVREGVITREFGRADADAESVMFAATHAKEAVR